MNQISPGVFALEAEMPYEATRLNLTPYWPFVQFGKAETEEMAVRLLWFSQQFGSWVGVTWQRIVEMFIADVELDKRVREGKADKSQLPGFTCIFVSHPQEFANGIHKLVELGMARFEEADVEGSKCQVLFPTPALAVKAPVKS